MEPPPTVPWAAGTAVTALEIPEDLRVGPVHHAFGGGIEAEFRRVGAAEDDEPGRLIAFDQSKVVVGEEAVPILLPGVEILSSD